MNYPIDIDPHTESNGDHGSEYFKKFDIRKLPLSESLPRVQTQTGPRFKFKSNADYIILKDIRPPYEVYEDLKF